MYAVRSASCQLWGLLRSESEHDDLGRLRRDRKPLADEPGTRLRNETSGAINEQPIGDGRVQVTIELHTINAISFISRGVDVMGGPVILGHRPMELVQPQNDAGKGDVFMRIVYISMPGMPIPDLIKLIRAPEPGQKLVSFEMSYQGRGITEDGRYVEFGIKSSDPLMYSLPENAQNTPPAGYTTLDGFDG